MAHRDPVPQPRHQPGPPAHRGPPGRCPGRAPDTSPADTGRPAPPQGRTGRTATRNDAVTARAYAGPRSRCRPRGPRTGRDPPPEEVKHLATRIPDLEFGSTGEAIGVMKSAARYLAGADYPGLPAETLADVLAGMEQVDAAQAAIRGRAGDAFIDAKAHLEWGQKNLGAWYRNETKVTGPAAKANRGWVKQLLEHPLIIGALAEQHVISPSWALRVAGWTIQLPEQYVQRADEILMEAARNGVDLAGLARIAAELGALLADPSKDKDKEPGPGLRLDFTFEGAGVLHGDLSPACAAKVKAVLEALADAMTAPGDDRSRHEKLHDALEDAMTRLLAARLVPQSQGAPTTAIAHIHFGDLVAMDQDSVLLDHWKQDIAAQWAAEQAGASTQPGDGGCWLTGDEARRVACDAMIVPIVTANLDTTHLGELILACITYHQAAQAQA